MPSEKAQAGDPKPPAEVLIDLQGSWQDERDADQIIEEVKRARRNSNSLAEGV
jgi:hypothetical protein